MFRFRAGTIWCLMDVEMPVMDGYAATREIRRFEQDTGAPATPVLALTAHAFAEMAAKRCAAGLPGHLTKPIRKITLLEALANYSAGIAPDGCRRPPAAYRGARLAQLSSKFASNREWKMSCLATSKNAAKMFRSTARLWQIGTSIRIRMLGHKMKGTGAGYGFAELTLPRRSALKRRRCARIRRDDSRARSNEFAVYVGSVELEYPE